jgi:hypothetical protein
MRGLGEASDMSVVDDAVTQSGRIGGTESG